MDKESILKIKIFIWAISAGIIVSFFFSTNFLAWATSFNPGDSVMLISPIMCGLMLGIVTWEVDAIYTVFSSFILTTVATVGVVLTLLSPMLLGATWVLGDYYIYVAQNVMISIILILPLSLLGAMVGRLFAENTIMSSIYRVERDQLRSETHEWYMMLEEKLDEKKAAIEDLRAKQQEADVEAQENLKEETQETDPVSPKPLDD